MSSRLPPTLVAPRSLFAREPEWQFSLMLALEVVFLFIAVPALGGGKADRDVVTLLQLVLAGLVITLIAQSAWLRAGLAASFALTLLARLLPGVLPQITTVAMSFFYNALVTAVMARAVFGSGKVNYHRIAGAVFIYLNSALLFALAYSIIRVLAPDALHVLPEGSRITFSELVHFSFTTLTSIGDNQIVPESPLVRSLMDLETIVGQLFPAILLSRLVGLHLAREQ